MLDRSALALALCLSLPAPVHAQEAAGRPSVTRTRLVVLFSELETDCLKAIQRKDAAALQRRLHEDFQVWTPEPPGSPLPREEWLDSVLKGYELRSFKLHQMAVRSFGETAVVSFVLHTEAAAGGADKSGDSFVVDVWVQHGQDWLLSDRYVSEAPAAPGATSTKPTGKG
jgi:ketosteroid isomerase-like protein